MEHFLSALAKRFGNEALTSERQETVQLMVKQFITTYHPTHLYAEQLSHQLSELLLLPSTIGALLPTSLYPDLITATQKVVLEHWMPLAIELGFEHPAKRFNLVLYHGFCPDGLAAAWCFWRHNRQLEVVGMTHGQEPPSVKGRRVVVVDFSFKRPILEKLKVEAELFEVKDHHKSAQKDLAELDYCDFDMSRAGCEISWSFLEGLGTKPFFLQAIADHDVWRKIPRSEAIVKALHKRKLVSFEGFDQMFADPDIEAELLVEGRAMMKHDKELIDKALKYTKLYKFREYTVRVGIPPAGLRSEFGHEMCLLGDCDFSMTWQYCLEKDEYWLSLRSMPDLVDVSEIASSFTTGGGHYSASGITLHGKDGENIRKYFTPIDSEQPVTQRR